MLSNISFFSCEKLRSLRSRYFIHVLDDDICYGQINQSALDILWTRESRHVTREVISFDSCTIRHFGLFRFNSDWTRQFFYQDFWRCILPISTPLTTMMSQCRQNYHEECEAGINKQINLELYASYVYLSMVGFVMKHSLILRRWTWTKCVLFLLKRPITSIVMMWRCQDSTSSCWNSRMKNANTLKR